MSERVVDVRTFKDLTVWQKSQDFAVAIIDMVASLPSDRATNVVVQQLLRSSTSIGANIAEGYGRFSTGAYRNHLSIARGSANESLSWLNLLLRSGRIDQSTHDALDQSCLELLRMVSAMMIQADRAARTSGSRRT